MSTTAKLSKLQRSILEYVEEHQKPDEFSNGFVTGMVKADEFRRAYFSGGNIQSQRSSVSRAIRRLEDRGLVEVWKTRRGTFKTYLCLPETVNTVENSPPN